MYLRSQFTQNFHQTSLNHLTPMSDEDRISPYNNSTISCRKVMRNNEEYQLADYLSILYNFTEVTS